jgi:hypothetical protein
MVMRACLRVVVEEEEELTDRNLKIDSIELTSMVQLILDLPSSGRIKDSS